MLSVYVWGVRRIGVAQNNGPPTKERVVHIRFVYTPKGTDTPVIVEDRSAPEGMANEFLTAFNQSHNPRLSAFLVDDDQTDHHPLNCGTLWTPWPSS